MPKFKIGQRVRITGGYERGMALTITHIGLWPNDTTHTYTGHFDNGAPCKLHYVESSLTDDPCFLLSAAIDTMTELASEHGWDTSLGIEASGLIDALREELVLCQSKEK
jgi:hypothetical protein